MNEVAIVSKTKTMTVYFGFLWYVFCCCFLFCCFPLLKPVYSCQNCVCVCGGGGGGGEGGVLCMHSVMYVQKNNCIHRISPVWPSHQDLAEG